MANYSLEDLLNSGKYSKDIYSLDDLNKKYSFTVTTPSFESQYARMRALAVQENDFQKVLDIFQSLMNKSFGMGAAKHEEVLREAHVAYTIAQKQLAKVFGDQGHFEVAMEHLRNACFGFEMRSGYGRGVTLEPPILEEEVNTLTKNAMRNTPTEYFFLRLDTAMQEGDLLKVERYSALTLQSLREKGVTKAPEPWRIARRMPLRDERQKADLMMQATLTKLWRKANGIVIGKKIDEALGYAVREGNYDPATDKERLGKLREEMQDIVFNVVRRTVPDERVSDAVAGALLFFEKFVDPTYDQLLACRQDPDHPLKALFSPKKEGVSGRKIIGAERKPITTAAVVPRSFYAGIAARTGMCFPVHPFFNSVVERYA